MTDAAQFTERLKAEGFQEILTREIPPNQDIPQHSHAWDARGLTLKGYFKVVSASGEQLCPPGQYFDLAADTPHTETAGPEGATLLIGRRRKD
jgi:quercetin dioxygenase-like cupin family protein